MDHPVRQLKNAASSLTLGASMRKAGANAEKSQARAKKPGIAGCWDRKMSGQKSAAPVRRGD
jgi:hypothetical protein